MSQVLDEVAAWLAACGVDPGRSPMAVMERLWADLAEANRSVNLTRVTTEAGFWVRHVADSVAVGLAVPELLAEALTVADVGCGAGFPLLPLAWANPELRITGLESRLKKAGFVAREIAALGLTNAAVAARRAREAARLDEHAGRYHAVLLRAVGPAARCVRECRGLLADEPGAALIHYKTPQAIEAEGPLAEREAARWGFTLDTSPTIRLPAAGGTRQFLIMRRPG